MGKVFNLVMNTEEIKQFCIERIGELGNKLIRTDKENSNNYLDGKIDGYREVLRALSIDFTEREIDLSWRMLDK